LVDTKKPWPQALEEAGIIPVPPAMIVHLSMFFESG